MEGLSLKQESALIRIQCAVRCHEARSERRRLKEDSEEEERWRKALARRRERIERLEREINIVEEMPPVDVDRYSSTARYGRNNLDAAARTIQGVFRVLVRTTKRARARSARQDAASRVIQRFVKKAARSNKEKKSAGTPSKAKREAQDRKYQQAADDLAGELPSLQRVAELQARVNQHLEDRKKARGIAKRSENELIDLAERGRMSMQVYKDGLVEARLETLKRALVREETSTLFNALWGTQDLASLTADVRIQTSANTKIMAAIPPAPKEYVALLTQIARSEHRALLAALRGGFAPISQDKARTA